MLNKNAPIGVVDSGVGGLSVVLELQKQLPDEDIIYFGDTANCPYGNKTNEQLLTLSGKMLRYLQDKGVKCIALACNTTSALADTLRTFVEIPIITVAECAADAIASLGMQSVGLIATVSTVNSGIYKKRIHAIAPNVKMRSIGSANLAALVENRRDSEEELDAEIRNCMQMLTQDGVPEGVILGCTHYPLVLENFKRCCPTVSYIDPAPYQAKCVKEFLEDHHLRNNASTATLTIYTTGAEENFLDACRKNGLDNKYNLVVNHIDN